MEKLLTGFHAIEERIASSADTNAKNMRVLYSKPGPRVKKIISLATGMNVICNQVENSELDSLVKRLPENARDHRGIVLCITGETTDGQNLVAFEEWLMAHDENHDESANEKCTVLVLDSITDPHNVGAILRSCDQFGAALVVLTETRSIHDVTKNETVARASAGASGWVPVAVVKNLARAVEQLKRAGFWVYAADADGDSLPKVNFAKKSVLIMGSEGSGISKLLTSQADAIVSIPTCGKLDSLNVSVAAGVLLYELSRR